ncbi:unnamed protein product, partial [Didymodactylos carnosus]
WNDLVSLFRSNIELRKFRRNYFKGSYENCFSSADAINCMISILQKHPNFINKKIEREHAIKLLDKFYQSKVFSDVNKADRRSFVEDNGIYQLLPSSDGNIFHTRSSPKKARPISSSPSFSSTDTGLSSSRLSMDSATIIGLMWKEMFIERIEKYLLLKRNRNGGYVLNKFEQEMKRTDYTQVLLNLQTPMPVNVLSIAEKYVDWLPESMSVVADFPTSIITRNLPDYPSFIVDVLNLIINVFDTQASLLSTNTLFISLIDLISNRGEKNNFDYQDNYINFYCFLDVSPNSPLIEGTSSCFSSDSLQFSSSKSKTQVQRIHCYNGEEPRDNKFRRSRHVDLVNAHSMQRRKSLSACELFQSTRTTGEELQSWLEDNKKQINYNLVAQGE